MASGLPYVHPRKAGLAHKIGGENRPTVLSARHWERLARAIGLAPEESRARISALIEQIPDALADTARNPDLSLAERRVAGTITDQIVGWLQTPRLAMS